MFNDFSDSGIEFQIETPILVKDFFIFSILEVFTVKHSFEDDLVLQLCIVLVLVNFNNHSTAFTCRVYETAFKPFYETFA